MANSSICAVPRLTRTARPPTSPVNLWIIAQDGLLESERFQRSRWSYLNRAVGHLSRPARILMLAMDKTTLYTYGRKSDYYRVQLADPKSFSLASVQMNKQETQNWRVPTPLRVQAMVVTDNALAVAGPKGDWHL